MGLQCLASTFIYFHRNWNSASIIQRQCINIITIIIIIVYYSALHSCDSSWSIPGFDNNPFNSPELTWHILMIRIGNWPDAALWFPPCYKKMWCQMSQKVVYNFLRRMAKFLWIKRTSKHPSGQSSLWPVDKTTLISHAENISTTDHRGVIKSHWEASQFTSDESFTAFPVIWTQNNFPKCLKKCLKLFQWQLVKNKLLFQFHLRRKTKLHLISIKRIKLGQKCRGGSLFYRLLLNWGEKKDNSVHLSVG